MPEAAAEAQTDCWESQPLSKLLNNCCPWGVPKCSRIHIAHYFPIDVSWPSHFTSLAYDFRLFPVVTHSLTFNVQCTTMGHCYVGPLSILFQGRYYACPMMEEMAEVFLYAYVVTHSHISHSFWVSLLIQLKNVQLIQTELICVLGSASQVTLQNCSLGRTLSKPALIFTFDSWELKAVKAAIYSGYCSLSYFSVKLL